MSVGGLGLALSPIVKGATPRGLFPQDIPDNNFAEAKAIPRVANSMPGLYPGKVVKADHNGCVVNGEPVESAAYEMLKASMLALTGASTLQEAWLKFVKPNEIIGLKVNPVAGKMLTTSHAVTRSIIKQMEEAGISRSNMVIWDRREFQLHETGYTEENYPGIRIIGTECQDAEGSYYDTNGRLYSEDRIDKNHYLYADVEEKYDAETIPYMVNEGKYSYYTKICTEQIDKIINIPILKNAGAAVTLCLKNLAFGSISNTGRLHAKFWNETCAYACAFPPIRDKVVLNIVDGLIGCFDGGPAANPQFICQYNTMLVGSDPVAVDRIGHDIVLNKRIEEKRQAADRESAHKFMQIAEELQLGIADRGRIELKEIQCS